MDIKYRVTKTTVSYLRYHIIFCPRYRRHIFKVNGVAELTEQLVKNKCEEMNIEVLNIFLGIDYIYLFIDVPASLNPSEVITHIKNHTSTRIRNEYEEFSKMPGLWTRSYFISTEDEITQKTIHEFVERQQKRY